MDVQMWTSAKRSARHQEDSFARSVRFQMKEKQEVWAERTARPRIISDNGPQFVAKTSRSSSVCAA